MSVKNLAYIQLNINGSYDLVSLHSGEILDTLQDVSGLVFTGNVINLKENGYSKD